MFDIGWTEMLVIAVVAIIVVGPKDLPGMLRTFGQAMKKVRALAGDFQKQFDEAIKDAELDGVKDTINDVRSLDPTKAIKDKLNPLTSELEDVKKSVGADVDFDPKELFDEDKVPSAPQAETVDVDAALERQKIIDAEFAKVAPSSGKNAVPGFGGPAADPLPADPNSEEIFKFPRPPESTAPKPKTAKRSTPKKAAAKKPTAKKTAPKKVVAKKPPAKKVAAKKPAAKAKPKAKPKKPKPAPKAKV